MAENEIIPRLFGPYLVTEKLATDALGRMYRARKIDDAKVFVRLRIFDAPGLDSESILVAIEQNGSMHNFLKNPAVVRDVDMDSVEGDAYLAHREMGGRTLDLLLAGSRSRPFPIPVEHSLFMAEKIATALDHAYNTKIDDERTLHGCVWPGFIEVSDEGETRLTGFGLAEGILASSSTPAVSRLLFPYLAPEVRAGGGPSPTGDLYSTAAILFELLTGAPPPEQGAASAAVGGRLFGSGEPVPPNIAAVLKTALSVAPEGRYQTAGDLRRDLGKLLFSGTYAPSTFNFAFFLTNLFKDDIAREQGRRNNEIRMDPNRYPRPAVTARPPRLIAPPRLGVPVSAVEEAPATTSKGKAIGIGIAAAVALGLAITAITWRSHPVPPRVTPKPAPAPAPVQPPPTTGMSPDEFKQEVARRLNEEVTKFEADQKVKHQKEIAARVFTLKPVEQPLAPSAAAPAPRPLPLSSGAATAPVPAAVVARPTPIPVSTAVVTPPAAPAVHRGDLVPLSEVDAWPEILTVVKPDYPRIARQMNIGGTVFLNVLVSETGSVSDLKVIRDAGAQYGLTRAAETAVRRWTFKPALKGGVPVKTWFTVQVPFVI